MSVALSEAEVHWRTFLQSLVARQLHGVKLITSDAHPGLRAAIRTVELPIAFATKCPGICPSAKYEKRGC